MVSLSIRKLTIGNIAKINQYPVRVIEACLKLLPFNYAPNLVKPRIRGKKINHFSPALIILNERIPKSIVLFKLKK